MSSSNRHYVISHAQNREDILLSGFFKDISPGFYVDVGANDPNQDSVTKNFYERGWSGVNIEPIVGHYNKLTRLRPRDINLNVGISNKKGHLRFREYKSIHGLSTFSSDSIKDYDAMAKKDSRYQDFVEHEVEIRTLADVLQEIEPKTVINFMKVDVEGYEYEVLEGNDWTKFRPQVICIEANHIKKDWRPLLVEHHYTFVFFDGLNDYYVANEANQVKNTFSYIETMLPTPILDYRAVGILEHYRNEKLKADAVNTSLNDEVFSLKHQVYTLESQLHELSRLRGLVAGIIKKLNLIIEELILPSAHRGVVAPSVALSSEILVAPNASADVIFRAMKKYDQSLKGLNPPEYRVRYKLLYLHRRLIQKVAAPTYGLLKKILKMVRNGLRGRR